MPSRASKSLRDPQQDRSRRTLDRILAATEALLREKLFEQITVAEIVAQADTSVGAFYARFSGKDALLPELYRRYDQALPGRIERAIAVLGAGGIEARVRGLVRMAVDTYRGQRGLMRAMALFARSGPGAVPAAMRSRRGRQHEQLVAAVLEHRDQITHSDPEHAVRFGLFTAFATCRDKILFGEAPHASHTRVSDDQLVAELTDLLVAYLTRPRSRSEIP